MENHSPHMMLICSAVVDNYVETVEMMVPVMGLEPMTPALKGRCSTN